MSKKHVFLVTSVLALVMVTAGLSGCASVSYYGQSVVGHSKLMLARQPVDKLIPKVDQPLKAQLELSQQLRAFASQELGLPDSKSYSSYVALERDYPVWNVIAAPEFSLDAKQWCYPIIGCASYRGYFKQAAAQRYASKLKQRGYETMVGGASAYSTLGWFSDPLLPSMMRYGEADFAETLFHELAHQRLYINGDSDFNEAFATIVGEVGAKRWLALTRPQEGDSTQQRPEDQQRLERYRFRLVAREQFYDLIEKAKVSLASVYSSPITETEKQAAKQRIFKQLKIDYQALKTDKWSNKPLFDNWFESEVNNARLAAFSTYRQQVPALMTLLSRCNDDLANFYQALVKPAMVDGKVLIPVSCG